MNNYDNDKKKLFVYIYRLPGIILILKHIRTKYGSSEGFIRQECGLTKEQCKVKKNLFFFLLSYHFLPFFSFLPQIHGYTI